MEEFVMYLRSKGLVKEEDKKKIYGMCVFLCPTWVQIYGIQFILTSLVNLDEGISPQVFISLTESDVDELGFSFGAKKVLKGLLKDLKVHV